MLRVRVIPCLLLKGQGLVKTVQFKDPGYVGDPRNAVKIFNEKEVDELTLLDITATREGRGPEVELVREIVSEAFMPVTYGGGITSADQARHVLAAGVEKVVVNTAALENPALVAEMAGRFGSQSVVVSLDVRQTMSGRYEVWSAGGTRPTGLEVADAARLMQARGAGEILLTSIDRDGTRAGYDTALIREVTSAVDVPVVACGGAGSFAHLGQAVNEGGAAAAAAGSLFVYQGRHRAVLISYPDLAELGRLFRPAHH